MQSVQEFLILLGSFINNVLIPFLFGLALLFFIWNVFRYFILKSLNKPDHENARQLALYGIAAFVFLVSIWGLVNILVNGLGVGGEESILPDYLLTYPSSEDYDDGSHFFNKEGDEGRDNNYRYNK